MKNLLVIISVLAALLLAACSPASSPTIKTEPVSSGKVTAPTVPGVAPAPPPSIITGRGDVFFSESLASTAGQSATDQMIVRTGSMALVVEDVAVAVDQISTMAARLNGTVVSSNVWQDRERLYGSISIRVPSERFEETIKSLRALAVDITNETKYC